MINNEEEKRINEFIIFCIERYKIKNNLTGSESYNILNKYNVFKYLIDNYEILHTQGEPYILNNIEEFIEIRKKEISS